MEKYFSINESGRSVRCKLYCAEPKSVRRVLVCCHGFTGHKDNNAAQKMADYLLRKYKDFGVITFDLPAHGDDARNKLSLVDCDIYIRLVCEYAASRFKTKELYGYATSFGGYLMLKYINEHGSPFLKLALRCPAVNMHAVFTGLMPEDDLRMIMRNKPVMAGFDRKVRVTREFVEELEREDISCRDFSGFSDSLIILQGTKDEIVSFDFVRDFAEKNSIEFIPVEGADHRFQDPRKMELAIKRIVEFFDL